MDVACKDGEIQFNQRWVYPVPFKQSELQDGLAVRAHEFFVSTDLHSRSKNGQFAYWSTFAEIRDGYTQ
jgi:hypothetical protein